MVNTISARTQLLAWCVLGLLAAAATALVLPVGGFTDLQVYVAGGKAVLRGAPLYQGPFALHTPGAVLPFTYPPIAALIFASFAALPWPVVVFGFIVSAAGCLWLVLRLTSVRRGALVLAVLCCALEPVWQTLLLGQLNLVLLAMVCADCLLGRTRWPRGLLTGIAGALKLTPLVFVVYFAVRRDWRALGISVGTFLTVTALGWLCAPRDSRAYWLGALLDPARIGNIEFGSNQSLRGFLYRLGVGTGWWIAGSVVLLGFVVIAARRAQPVATFGIVAIGGLLVSPVSWSHHWVYAIPFLVYLGTLVHARRNVFWYCSYGLLLAIFCVGPHWFAPHEGGAEFHWTLVETLFGNAYFLFGTCIILVSGIRALTSARRSDTSPGALWIQSAPD